MKFLTAILLSVAFVVPATASDITISIVNQPAQRWAFKQISTYEIGDRTRVSGRLMTARHIGQPRGHVDVAIYTKEGRLLEVAAAGISPSILTRKNRRKGGLRFSVEIPSQLPTGATINLAFHQDEFNSPSVLHNQNIAR